MVNFPCSLLAIGANEVIQVAFYLILVYRQSSFLDISNRTSPDADNCHEISHFSLEIIVFVISSLIGAYVLSKQQILGTEMQKIEEMKYQGIIEKEYHDTMIVNCALKFRK